MEVIITYIQVFFANMQKSLAKPFDLWYNHIVSFNVALQAIKVAEFPKCLKYTFRHFFVSASDKEAHKKKVGGLYLHT